MLFDIQALSLIMALFLSIEHQLTNTLWLDAKTQPRPAIPLSTLAS